MGRGTDSTGQGQPAPHDGQVSITDLGDRSIATAQPVPGESLPDRRPGSRRRTITLAVVLGTGVIAGLALLPSTVDPSTPPGGVEALPTTRDAPVPEAPEACDAIEQDQANASTGSDDALSTGELPSGYSRYGVITSPGTTELIGVLHPDGTLQVCEASALIASFEVRFPTETDLGQLPEKLTYAYSNSHGASKDGLTLELEGVRLPDGSVVDSVTLPDGRTVPSVPAGQ